MRQEVEIGLGSAQVQAYIVVKTGLDAAKGDKDGRRKNEVGGGRTHDTDTKSDVWNTSL